jgi:hypothetical protein
MNLFCDNQAFDRDFLRKIKMEDERCKMEDDQQVVSFTL